MQLYLCSNVYKSEFLFYLLTKVTAKESVLSKVCVKRAVVSKNQPNYRMRTRVILHANRPSVFPDFKQNIKYDKVI